MNVIATRSTSCYHSLRLIHLSLPPAYAVIGGGYIAVELAGILRALGAEVTMLVRGDSSTGILREWLL